MKVSYERATRGAAARSEITGILRRFGCESIGFMDDFAQCEVLLAFTHRGRAVQLRASAKGWAELYCRHNPWTAQASPQQARLRAGGAGQGHVAVNSVLRDWVKGQVTAVECGVLSFEAVFMPYMLTADGRPMIERMRDALPKPDGGKVVPLPGSRR